MDAVKVIRDLVESENYVIRNHCLEEMDKDGLSSVQVEEVILKGTKIKQNKKDKTFVFKLNKVMCCVGIVEDGEQSYVKIITAGRERR